MTETTVTRKQKFILHGLAFILPMVILGVAFALHEVYPFGDRQLLVTDYWHQYYPFLRDHWTRLREGGSLLWSWNAGGGHDYLAHFAYYLSSPLNFLIVLFPQSALREVLMVFTLLKTGFAGLFMSFFLVGTMKKYDVLLPIFSIFYALCAFILGYYWNIMWHDTIALMPLVLLGVHSLVKEGKYRLYIGSLALAVFANFYIGLFVCIMVAFVFFIRLFVEKVKGRLLVRRFLLMTIATAVGIGMSAMILLAAYSALSNSYRSETAFPEFRLYNHFAAVIGNFIPFTPPTSLDGLPNLYSGLLSIMLLPVFLSAKKIALKEKLVYLVLLVFLILSVNINILNFIWNGFTVTNMLPFRFSFIVSFVLVFMAYKAYHATKDNFALSDVLEMGIAALFFHSIALLGGQHITYIIYSGLLSVIYVALFATLVYVKDKQMIKFIIFAVVLAEISYTAYLGVAQVGTTTRNNFPNDYEQIQTLLDARRPDEIDFFRTELARPRTLNSPSAYGFNGLSLFSSFANVSATEFMENIGLLGWPRGNRYTYSATTPLANAFLNVRYVIARSEQPLEGGQFWDWVDRADNNHLYRNRFALPFGFAVHPDIIYYEGNARNPIMAQNDLFRRATGLDGDLFTFMWSQRPFTDDFDVEMGDFGRYTFNLREEADLDNASLTFEYVIQTSGFVYGFFNFHNINNIHLTHQGLALQSVEVRRPYIFSVGFFSEQDFLTLRADTEMESGSGTLYMARLDDALFEEGFQILNSETLELTHFSDTAFGGNITVSEPRILYLSLAYGGNWRATVNGQPAEILPIGGAMAGLALQPGTHVIEFHYRNSLVNLGLTVSAISTVIYGVILWFSRKNKNIFENFFDRILPILPEPEPEPVLADAIETDETTTADADETLPPLEDVTPVSPVKSKEHPPLEQPDAITNDEVINEDESSQ